MLASTPTYSFTPLDYVSLVFQGIYFSVSESVPKEMVVTAKGVGDTQDEAIKSALNTAVQQSVGVLIISDQTVKNDKVVRNLVAQYSSGVVNSYEVKKCEGKPVKCEVTAKVSPWKFMRKLEGDSQVLQVNGGDLFMKHQTARIALLQREKVADYYMGQIRQSGLDIVIKSVNVEPSSSGMARLLIDYEVKWNKEFKTEIIRFLEKLEKDTVKDNSNRQVYIQWGPTGLFENRVRINTYNERFQAMMLFHIHQPTYVKFDDFGVCENLKVDDVFTIDWYGARRQKLIEVAPEKLKDLTKISMSIGC